MSEALKEHDIAHAGMYQQENHAPILRSVEPGDRVFLSFSGDAIGTTTRHYDVEETTAENGTVTVQFASDAHNTPTLRVTSDGDTEVVIAGRTETYNGRVFELYRVERYPENIVSDLSDWEVHLCYNLGVESPSDEVLFVNARNREEAIKLARRRSDNNPPEVGSAYNDGEITRRV